MGTAAIADVLIKFMTMAQMGLNLKAVVTEVARMERDEGAGPEEITKYLHDAAVAELQQLEQSLAAPKAE